MKSKHSSKACVIFFLLSPSCIWAQAEKYAITLGPAIVSGSLAMQPGFQFRLKEKWNLSGELALPLSKHEFRFEKLSLFRISAELQYWPVRVLKGRYYALQAGYVNRKLHDQDTGSFLRSASSWQYFLYPTADIKSPVWFSSIKMGREKDLPNGFFFDAFFGLGIRIINTRYDADVIGSYFMERKEWAFAPPPSWNCDCSLTRLHATAGIRIGRRF